MPADLHFFIQTDFFFLEVQSLNSGNLAVDPLGNKVLDQLFDDLFFHLRFIESCGGEAFNESACLLGNNFRRIVNGK